MDVWSKEKLTDYIYRMMQEVVRVNSIFQIWLELEISREHRIETLKVAPAFFSLVHQSLISDVIISLAKLYDSGAKAGSVQKLLGILSSCTHLFRKSKIKVDAQTIENDKKKVLDKMGIINNLFVWRDKVFAHIDKDYFFDYSVLLKEANLTVDNVNELFYCIYMIMNNYLTALGESPFLLENPEVGEHTARVLYAMDLYRKEDDVYRIGMGLHSLFENE